VAVLHIVQFALPEISSGYTIRTAAILRVQRAMGLEPIVLTSPRHPTGPDSEVEGVLHYRSGQDPRTRVVWLRDSLRVRALARRIREIAELRRDIKVLHAHSPVLCGMASLRAGRALGLPVVYEVRGLWEESMRKRGWLSAPRYALARMIEARVSRAADAVAGISEGLKRDFVSRGVPEGSFEVVPNGVDTTVFQPLPSDSTWRAARGLGAGPVLLYLGALRDYEGVDLLLDAVPRIHERFPSAQLFIVGDGEARDMLAQRARASGDAVRLLPPVPHSDVGPFYAAADIVVYPRRSMRATELVTPLKPLEAMAMGKAIVAADVGGIKELLSNGETARLFTAGSASSLADACIELCGNAQLREALGARARAVAVARHDWRAVVQRYLMVYQAAGVTGLGG